MDESGWFFMEEARKMTSSLCMNHILLSYTVLSQFHFVFLNTFKTVKRTSQKPLICFTVCIPPWKWLSYKQLTHVFAFKVCTLYEFIIVSLSILLIILNAVICFPFIWHVILISHCHRRMKKNHWKSLIFHCYSLKCTPNSRYCNSSVRGLCCQSISSSFINCKP